MLRIVEPNAVRIEKCIHRPPPYQVVKEMNVMRPVTAFLDWITSLKGFFISLLIYGAIEFALYYFFESSRVVTADRSEGWFDRLQYPEGSFRGTYLYVMQNCMIALYLIAFAAKLYLIAKAVISNEFKIADVRRYALKSYRTTRGVLTWASSVSVSHGGAVDTIVLFVRLAIIWGVFFVMAGAPKSLLLHYLGMEAFEFTGAFVNAAFIREGEPPQADLNLAIAFGLPFLIGWAFEIIESLVLRALVYFGVVNGNNLEEPA